MVRCEDCGFSYFNPSPTEESLKYYYEDYIAHVPEKVSFLERLYYRFFRNVHGSMKPGKLLDIGCGNGKYLDSMRSVGWDVSGVDTGPACDFPRRELNIPVYEGHLWDHRFRDAFFDVVTLWFVIEHVWDPVRLIGECGRILKPGGQLIVSTLNSGSLEAKLFGRYWWHLLAPEHLSQFDEKSLRLLLQKQGFEIVHLKHEPICCGILGSLQNILDEAKMPIQINSLPFKLCFVPADFLCALFRTSGLITLYARKK